MERPKGLMERLDRIRWVDRLSEVAKLRPEATARKYEEIWWAAHGFSKNELQTSPERSFLDFPAEIRNQIYKEVLHQRAGVWIDEGAMGHPKEPGIINTCRAVRNEARPMYYAINEFICPGYNWNMQSVFEYFNKRELYREEGVKLKLRYTRRDYGPSTWENLRTYLEKWYKGETTLHPVQENCLDLGYRSRIDMNAAQHRLWDIARALRNAGTKWEVAKVVLDNAVELLESVPLNIKPDVSESCCTKRAEGKAKVGKQWPWDS